MFLYFCHEVLRRLVVSISHQRPLLLIISHLASIVGYTKKNKCVCFLHCKQSLKNSLLALIILLYGFWSKRGNWTRPGLKNNPVFWVSTSGRQKIQKKTMLYTQSLAHKSTRLPLPSNQREKFFSATRIQRSPPFTRIQRGRPFLEHQGAYLVLEYSSWNTEEPSFY